MRDTAEPDEDLDKLIATRLKILQAERKAVDRSGNDEEKLWGLLSESLKDFLPAEETTQDTADNAIMVP